MIVRRQFAISGLSIWRIISRHGIRGVSTMRKKNIMDWLRAIFSMVFYIGLFGGIGYLIQVVIL